MKGQITLAVAKIATIGQSKIFFKHLDKKWGPHTIDRFASFYNTQCTRFNLIWLVPGTLAVDELGQLWGKLGGSITKANSSDLKEIRKRKC